MTLEEVKSKKSIQAFLRLPVKLYKNEKNWIRPLDKDIEEVFDPIKNKLFRHGECIRWVLKNDQGEVIGRVAAFINQKTARKDNKQPTGGMGFFECINDQESANMLFDTCKSWLENRGMEAMDGPINFGERDKWWGCLVDGFTEPNYCMPYNFGYYKTLFENYGFKEYFKQFTFYRLIAEKLQSTVAEKANRIFNNPEFSFKHLNLKQMDDFAEDFQVVYNKAWTKHIGVREMPLVQAKAIMRKIKPIVDEELIWFAYHKDQPIAFYIMLPELNQIFKHLNGKFDLWAKLKFLWYKKIGACKKVFGVVFGVIPKFQGKGVEAAIIAAYANIAHRPNYQYKDIEMNWIGDFNPKMIRVVESIGGKLSKTHITYRKLFDESKPFERMKVIF